MATDYFDQSGVRLTGFYGGDARGLCIQLTIGDKYIDLPIDDMQLLFRAMALATLKYELKLALDRKADK